MRLFPELEQYLPRMCSEGLIFRKQHANRPTVFDFWGNGLDTGKNSNTDTKYSGADTVLTTPDADLFGVIVRLLIDTDFSRAKSQTPFPVSELLFPGFGSICDVVYIFAVVSRTGISLSSRWLGRAYFQETTRK